jgi:hypothetical protein
VNYDEFKACFLNALRKARLPVFSQGDETLDLKSLDREFRISVEPVGGQGTPPFHAVAQISWTWDALQTARGRTTEEDTLDGLLGHDAPSGITIKPTLRVDIKLSASLPWGKPHPLPAAAQWATWSREVFGRLEGVDRMVAEEMVREDDDGQLAILAWQGEPDLEVACGPGGLLRLKGVQIEAFQIIELPRKWDDPEQEPDDDPSQQLDALFRRIRAALHAWMEAVDALA